MLPFHILLFVNVIYILELPFFRTLTDEDANELMVNYKLVKLDTNFPLSG